MTNLFRRFNQKVLIQQNRDFPRPENLSQTHDQQTLIHQIKWNHGPSTLHYANVVVGSQGWNLGKDRCLVFARIFSSVLVMMFQSPHQ